MVPGAPSTRFKYRGITVIVLLPEEVVKDLLGRPMLQSQADGEEAMSVNYKGEEHTYLKPMPQHRFVERHLIYLMIEELNEAGWRLVRFNPRENREDITHFPHFSRQYPLGPSGLMHLKTKAWEAYDQWDEGYFIFKEENDEGRENWVRVIGGNGEDCISDYGDIKRFGAILEKVFLY